MVRFLDIARSQRLDLDDEKKVLIAEAHEAAESIPKGIALCALGSRKTYVKRICEEYCENLDPRSNDAAGTSNS
jgi:hypothetical protein